MKASKALDKAIVHDTKANDLLRPISDALAEILDDDCAHIVLQAGDGACVAYRNGSDNAAISFTRGIDHLLTLDKEQLLIELDDAGI